MRAEWLGRIGSARQTSTSLSVKHALHWHSLSAIATETWALFSARPWACRLGNRRIRGKLSGNLTWISPLAAQRSRSRSILFVSLFTLAGDKKDATAIQVRRVQTNAWNSILRWIQWHFSMIYLRMNSLNRILNFLYSRNNHTGSPRETDEWFHRTTIIGPIFHFFSKWILANRTYAAPKRQKKLYRENTITVLDVTSSAHLYTD